MTDFKAGLLFETSWEVCNKVGGIYTVLSTKARMLVDEFKERLIFIGPDVWTVKNPSPFFIERKTFLKLASTRLQLPHGLKIRVGRWDIPGSPTVVLVDYKPLMPLLNEIYGEMWESYGVDSLHAYGDYDESCAFSIASAMVIKALTRFFRYGEGDVIAHFDEWTTGMGLLWLKKHMPDASTIFTTHATCMGRSICSNGKPLYQYFNNYNGDQMAHELNMESKHSLEKAAAHQADCFTTVSEVTASECEQLLGKYPDVITPNGFEPDFVPVGGRYTRRRNSGREKLLSIASALTGEKYPEDTFIIATSGRNEYRNKGLDVFLDSMAEMGGLIKSSRGKVLAFVLVPAWVREPSRELSLAMQENRCIRDIDADVPDFLTHRLYNEDSDAVCCRLRQLEEEGKLGGDSNVKVIYVPCYLNGEDGMVNISYYDLLPALDLTIFPSYYEPWGYTPLESIAFNVPTITTDKAGFGQWVLQNFPNSLVKSGVNVVFRTDSGYQQTVSEIASAANDYRTTDPSDRVMARIAATSVADKANWRHFYKFYAQAYLLAMENSRKRKYEV